MLLFLPFIFIQKSSSSHWIAKKTNLSEAPAHTSARTQPDRTHINNVTLFTLTMKTVVEEPISCQAQTRGDRDLIARPFQIRGASLHTRLCLNKTDAG